MNGSQFGRYQGWCDIHSSWYRGVHWGLSSFRANPRQRPVTPELLDVVVALTKANSQRIYRTGRSMGDIGTLGLLAQDPDRFAAAGPFCGIWEPDDAGKIKSVPVWAFHGSKDTSVPVEGSRRMIAALQLAGGTPRFT